MKRMLHVMSDEQKLIVLDSSASAIKAGYKPGETVQIYRIKYEQLDSKSTAITRKIQVAKGNLGRDPFYINDAEYELMRYQWLVDNNKIGDKIGIVIGQFPDVTALYVLPRADVREAITRLRMNECSLDEYDLEENLGGRPIDKVDPASLDLSVDCAYDNYLDMSSNAIIVCPVELSALPNFGPVVSNMEHDEEDEDNEEGADSLDPEI